MRATPVQPVNLPITIVITGRVKVLLSSGYSMDGQVAAILERGCAGFIQKPFSIETLSTKIREILQ